MDEPEADSTLPRYDRGSLSWYLFSAKIIRHPSRQTRIRLLISAQWRGKQPPLCWPSGPATIWTWLVRAARVPTCVSLCKILWWRLRAAQRRSRGCARGRCGPISLYETSARVSAGNRLWRRSSAGHPLRGQVAWRATCALRLFPTGAPVIRSPCVHQCLTYSTIVVHMGQESSHLSCKGATSRGKSPCRRGRRQL